MLFCMANLLKMTVKCDFCKCVMNKNDVPSPFHTHFEKVYCAKKAQSNVSFTYPAVGVTKI